MMSFLLGCVLVLALCLLAANGQTCALKSSCSCEFESGKTTSAQATLSNGIIDLSPLDTKDPDKPKCNLIYSNMTRVLLLLQNRFSIVGRSDVERQDQFYYNPCSPINGPMGVQNMGCSVKANTAVSFTLCPTNFL